MNRIAFQAAIKASGGYQSYRYGACITCSRVEISDERNLFTAIPERILDRHTNGNIVYRIHAYDTRHNTIYCSDEVSLDAAMDIAELLDSMISVSHALFSWMDP